MYCVGPLFIKRNLNGATYFDLHREVDDGRISSMVENVYHSSEDLFVFQDDGAPPHLALPMRQFLNKTFSASWIGRRGHIVEWQPRSPDLTPQDYFF